RIDDDYATVGFPSFRQLNVYLDSLLRHYVTAAPVSNDEKAALVFGCAVAAKQVFTSEASGTFGVTQALAAYKRFHFCDATLLWPGDSLLLQHIAINVMNKMPVHFASLTQDETAGHNFVVDGFNSENYFHLNMGWGGVYNGWYKLPAQIPYNLTKIEGVIVDINPGYSLQDDNDAPARAQVLTLPVKSYENSIFPAGDVDWYKFALKQGTTITLHAEDFAAFHPSLKFWLYGPCSPDGADIRAGNHIACDDTSFSHTRPRIVFSVKDSGMYFLRVAGASDAPVKVPGDSIGAYVLQIDTVCANPSSVTGARGVAKAGFRVSDCYPNPFNPETRISYTLPSPGVVTVNMYDSRGSLVKNVVTGSVQSAGQHDLQINGQSLASGVYFVRVQYQGAVQSVKIILLK
ncbi:MAG: C10 family peptidase, partial [Ignavibacteria bacterium]|nr:C10 family peptidase [Ignavibacteria bacterium]